MATSDHSHAASEANPDAASSLLQAARDGDHDALAQLLQKEQRRIYAFGLRMCGDREDAADVAQETMLAVARGIHDFRGDAALSTWLFQIARSFCMKKRRRRAGAPAHTQPLSDAVAIASSLPSPEQQASHSEQQEALHQALASLPDSAREVVVLRDVEGLSAAEVSAVLGISVDAVKSRLHRARAALEAALRPTLAPEATAGPAASGTCPDILQRYSEKLEGELTTELCSELEHHLAGCPRCQGTCHALRQSLALCSTLPDVPDDVQRNVRRALQQFLTTKR